MRLATWNVNSVRARADRLGAWLGRADCDVVCLQETRCDDRSFPTGVFAAAGYEVAHHGSGPYNGVAIASRCGLDDVVAGFGAGDARLARSADDDWDPGWPVQPRVVAATCGGVRVVSVYAPNGRKVGHPHLRYKLAWLDELAAMLGPAAAAGEVVVAGDVNVAPTDADVDDPRRWRGRVLVSAPERERLAGLAAAGWVDVWRDRHPAPPDGPDTAGFTWWDGRDPSGARGLRLDLVLTPRPVADRVAAVEVDQREREGDRPSDHLPLVATILAR